MDYFNNRPRSRAGRRAVCDKESLEKERLSQRKEGFVRIDPSVAGHAMTEFHSSAPGFMADADRFHTDAAGEARLERMVDSSRRQKIVEQKRYDGLVKDEARWEALEQQRTAEEDKHNRWRAEGVKSQRNASSVPFDPITLEYYKTTAGNQLRNQDDRIKQRAHLRSENLHNHSHRSGINPITGEPLQ